jgi:hypothetical protein
LIQTHGFKPRPVFAGDVRLLDLVMTSKTHLINRLTIFVPINWYCRKKATNQNSPNINACGQFSRADQAKLNGPILNRLDDLAGVRQGQGELQIRS